MFLLDTNTLIYYFKGQGGIAEKLPALPASQLAVSTISLFELETGLRKSSRPGKRPWPIGCFRFGCPVVAI